MVQVTLEVNPHDLPTLPGKIPQIMEKGLKLTGLGMIGELTKNSPVDEGLLRQWFIESESNEEIVIKTPAEYAQYVNDGTGVYAGNGIIRPSGKALKFEPGAKWSGPVGKDGFVYLAYSRGQKGQKFVEKSIEATNSKITGYFQIAIREVLS